MAKPVKSQTDQQRKNRINSKGGKNVHSAKNNYPKR